MANINLYKSHTLAFFASSHHFEIFTFQNSWPWKCRSRSWCTTFAVAPFDGKCSTFYLVAIVMYAPSLAVYEIFAKMPQLWPWKWRSRCRRAELPPFDWICSNPYRWFCFLRILATWQHTFTQRSNTHEHLNTHTYTHIHTHTHNGDDYRQNMTSRFA